MTMKIGELAGLTDTPIETIRYYEREGLLPPAPRSGGNYRLYGEAHAERLSFIRHCRSLDMALDEVRVLLHVADSPASRCDEVNTLLDEHLGHVMQRIRELRRLEARLKELQARCRTSKDSSACGILNELMRTSKRRPAPPADASGHLRGVHGSVAFANRKPSPPRRAGEG